MKMTTRKILLATAVIGMMTATAAQAMPPHGGQGCGSGHRGFGSEARINRLADKLDLAPGQRERVRGIVDKARPGLRAVHDKMQDNRKAMRALMQQDKVSEAELRQLANARGQLVAEMTVQRARMKSDIRAVLTPEQRDKLKQHFEQRHRVSSGPSPAGSNPEPSGQES